MKLLDSVILKIQLFCLFQRETITLKRAWDNMKAFTRKACAEQRGNLLRTGGGPHAPPPPPQHRGLISMVEEVSIIQQIV